MSTHLTGRQAELRAVVLDFLSARLNAKLEKLPDDDAKRSELEAQFEPAAWLADAARRVSQIQAVTHSLKPIHPDAKGSSLFCDPLGLPPLTELGSHVLGEQFDADVVGNAAALDVYKFLKQEHDGRSLLALATQADPDLCAALSADTAQAQAWMAAFAGLAEARGEPSSHTLAKQIYWLAGTDPHDDASYHLLAPLYPTSLIHRVHQTLQDDRFGEAAKAAREARKANAWHERPVHEYPNLAVQKLGGTKPQNISQLNSERGGNNLLLASLPPVWQSLAVKPLWGVDSLFKPFGRRRSTRELTRRLREFLLQDPKRNKPTRTNRDEIVDALLDDFLQFTAELRTLEPGWSQDPQCTLPPLHSDWLDPAGTGTDAELLIDGMATAFANWLNGQLADPLPLGDPEFLHWRSLARELFKEAEREDRL